MTYYRCCCSKRVSETPEGLSDAHRHHELQVLMVPLPAAGEYIGHLFLLIHHHKLLPNVLLAACNRDLEQSGFPVVRF